ncbi:hypothetical protein HDV00_007287 [Rhizophlyctis rosea]|nr:hypothetical protein HDV00_007287 [Rhizophlyctis rosea]
MSVNNAFRSLSILSTGLFTGIALFLAVIEVPNFARYPAKSSLATFKTNYRRLAIMQPTFLLISIITTFTSAYLSSNSPLLYTSACLSTFELFFTGAFIVPINKKLLQYADAGDADGRVAEVEVKNLLRRWGYLHQSRTIALLIGFVLVSVPVEV